MRDLRSDLRARGRGFTRLEILGIFAGALILGALLSWGSIAISSHLHREPPPAMAGPIPGVPNANRETPPPAVAASREPIQRTTHDPNELLREARLLPKFEEGRMVGVTVTMIKPGSLLQRNGIKDGDLITQFNGTALNSPAEGAKIVREFANAEQFHVVIRGPDGAERIHDFARE